MRVFFEKIEKLLFFLAGFFLPIQTVFLFSDPTSFSSFSISGIYVFQLVFLLACLVFFRDSIERARAISIIKTQNKFFWLFLFLFLFFNIYFSIFWPASLHAFWRILCPLLFFCCFLLSGSGLRDQFFNGLIFGSILPVGLVFLQIVTQSVFPSTWLGISAQNPISPGPSVIDVAGGRFLRAYGTFPHPNILAAYILLVISVIFYRKNLFIKSIPVFFVLLSALFLTVSRAAILGLGLWLIFVFLKNRQKNNYFFGGKVFYLVVPLVLVVGLFFSLILPRLSPEYLGKHESTLDRQTLQNVAGGFFLDRPLVGVGAGNFVFALGQTKADWPIWRVEPVHNFFLLFLTEFGLVGLFFLIMFAWPVRKIFVLNFEKLLLFLPSMILDHFWLSLPSGNALLVAILSLVFVDFYLENI